MAEDARNYDFFGDGGVAAAPAAPDDPNDLPNPANPGGISNNELARRRLRANQTNSVDKDAYQAFGPVNTSADITGYTTDAQGNRVSIVRGTQEENDAINAKMGTVAAGVVRGGTPTYGSPGTQTLSFIPPAPATPQAAGSNVSPLVQGQLDQGQNLVDQALATEPTPDPAHAVTPENLQKLTPVVDPNLAQDQNTQQALAMSKDLIDRILGTPLQTQQLGDQALSSQLAIARSGRGGAGAVQDALNNAQAQAPQIQAQTAQQSIQEQTARAGAASQAASIFAGVANQGADRAVNIATANQGAGLAVMNNLTTLTGQDLQFDQAKMMVIGQLARDYFANAQAFAQMDTSLQIAQWNNSVTAYGIDKTFDAAVKKISADEGIGPFDAFKLILGGATALPGIAKMLV